VVKILSEFLSTFALIFLGTGAIMLDNASNGAISHVGICAIFGSIVCSMIYIFGPTSGAQMNPAVTLNLFFDKSLEGKWVLPYLLAQFFGAISASLTLKLLFPDALKFGETLPSGSLLQAILIEFFLMFFLMITILKLGNYWFAGIIIGLFIFFAAFYLGPFSGASMNPFRSLAPAIVSGNLKNIWIYLVIPVLGGLCAVLLNRKINKKI
jgi:aquaporin NIP